MQKTIVAIGGGELKNSETLSIDKEIIKLTGKKNPTLLFIPTASSDSKSYWETIDNYYGKKLKCKTDVLYLVSQTPSNKEIKSKILNADIIYVGGGNTLKMMKRWRRLGVDQLLVAAWKKGTILCGISAGAICWFDSGHSDSVSFYNKKNWQYINVKGLGFVQGVLCPHYNSHTLSLSRKEYFQRMIKKIGKIGIAIDNNAALIVVDDKYRIISSKKSGVYKVFKEKNKVISEELKKSNNLEPMSGIFSV